MGSKDADKTRYWPILASDSGEPIESEPEYVRRVAPMLPNIPPDILGQYFYDHYRDTGKYEWLGYPSLRFEKSRWPISELLDETQLHSPAVDTRVGNITRELEKWGWQSFEDHARVSRIVQHFQQHKTWPRPIVVIENPHDNLVSPDGWRCEVPFHLWEGHFRLGVLRAFSDKIDMLPDHNIWLVTPAA